MGDEFPPLERPGCGLAERRKRVQLRAVGLERLFHRRRDDLPRAFGFEDAAFAVFRFERDDGADPYLGGLFEEPFEAVGVFGRRHGHYQPVGERFPLRLRRGDAHHTSLWVVVGDLATK